MGTGQGDRNWPNCGAGFSLPLRKKQAKASTTNEPKTDGLTRASEVIETALEFSHAARKPRRLNDQRNQIPCHQQCK